MHHSQIGCTDVVSLCGDTGHSKNVYTLLYLYMFFVSDNLLKSEFQKEYYLALQNFLKEEYQTATIFPDKQDIFNAFKLTSYKQTKVVILGQDPYINPNEAHGLAFSVKPTAKIPRSLANVFKELATDLGCKIPNNGCLENWAKQGVLLLNTVLTVRQNISKSHANQGWEIFTDYVIKRLNKKNEPLVFMLWGNDAQKKQKLLNNPKHLILKAAHPSPLASKAYFGCKHFSQANDFLQKNKMSIVNWQIQNV